MFIGCICGGYTSQPKSAPKYILHRQVIRSRDERRLVHEVESSGCQANFGVGSGEVSGADTGAFTVLPRLGTSATSWMCGSVVGLDRSTSSIKTTTYIYLQQAFDLRQRSTKLGVRSLSRCGFSCFTNASDEASDKVSRKIM